MQPDDVVGSKIKTITFSVIDTHDASSMTVRGGLSTRLSTRCMIPSMAVRFTRSGRKS